MLQLPTSSFLKNHHTRTSQNGCDAGEPKNCSQKHELEKGKSLPALSLLDVHQKFLQAVKMFHSQCVVTGYKNMLLTDENLREHS